MRRYLPALPWLALALVGWLLWRTHDNSVRDGALEEARTAAAEMQRDSALALLPALEAVALHRTAEVKLYRDSLALVRRNAAARITTARREERAAEERTAVAGQTVDATVDSVRTALPVLGDSLEAQIDRERDGHRSTADALRSQIRATSDLLDITNATLSAETRRADAQTALTSGLRSALAAETEVAESWEARASRAEKPGVMARLRQGAPYVIGGAACVLAFDSLERKAGCAAGVTVGLSLRP